MVFDLKVEATIRRRDLILGLAGRVAPPAAASSDSGRRAAPVPGLRCLIHSPDARREDAAGGGTEWPARRRREEGR